MWRGWPQASKLPKKPVDAGPEGDGLAFKTTPVRAAEVVCVCQTSDEQGKEGKRKPESGSTEDVGLFGEVDAGLEGRDVRDVRDVSVNMSETKDAEAVQTMEVGEKFSEET